jgi:hypothetical protein
VTTTTTVRLTRLAEFLLVRLLVPTKRPTPPSRLREEISRLLREPLDADRWQSLMEELTGNGLMNDRPMRLTESGRSHALELLGIKQLPPRTIWRTLKDRYLVPHALGITEEASETSSRSKPWESLGVPLLRRRYDLPAGASHTLNDALEALACKELGFPEETKLKAVQDRILCRLLGTPEPLHRKNLSKQIVRVAADAPRADLTAIREAVLHDWISPPVSHPAPEADGHLAGERVEREAFDLPAFAATIEAVARACPTGRFGDNKVFIHHVWKQLQSETHLPVRSLEEFKQRLVEANHAGLLHLSRADLVQAMDPADVRQSETRYLDAVFHFIRTGGDRP